MSALCNVTPYLFYSALLYWSVSFSYSLVLCLTPNSFNSALTILSKHVYLSFYSIGIASPQGNHGYFSYIVINKNTKNKIRQSCKILQSSLTLLCTIICLIVLFTLHNIPFSFKIFSIAKSYLII